MFEADHMCYGFQVSVGVVLDSCDKRVRVPGSCLGLCILVLDFVRSWSYWREVVTVHVSRYWKLSGTGHIDGKLSRSMSPSIGRCQKRVILTGSCHGPCLQVLDVVWNGSY